MAQGAMPFGILDMFLPGASAMAQFGTQAAQRGVEVNVRPGGMPGQRVRPSKPRGQVIEEAKKGEAKPGEEKPGEKKDEKADAPKPTLIEKAKKHAPAVGATLGIGTALYFVGKAVLRG